ncbi:MAG: hypothetical protein ABR543_07010 [Gemmatimonadaceae bacterium]
MKLDVLVEPARAVLGDVTYRWDADTEILSAVLPNSHAGEGGGVTGSVELAGPDACCLVLDVVSGYVSGVEVAVWPDVRSSAGLAPPEVTGDALLRLALPASESGVVMLEVDTPIAAETDSAERTIHFRLGASRASRTYRIATDVLVDVDARNTVSGLWLLNVPPFPKVS